ncbi:hypothetical protein D187_004227 [Cystobacter fuscus DSM 2262]|uniref:Uncharacterized protein n=1 Tax=Cystobacter fuscus (strain ATCC 25194 / DSM 2262 / NBRC 100088 / M29) TaxID=1242864 RepID=S9P165_CYSF2|nr:hypothetical protein D187_004227 [Cystobacter fuscus DSM 2262]
MPPRPFRIDVPQDVLTDLHRRLAAATSAPDAEDKEDIKE